jgi:DNA primase
VLVFDADAGGATGVDRALELFAGHDVELAIATLPVGLDPCDLLIQEGGADAFRLVLESAVDALEFKLEQALAREGSDSVEARRRVVEAVLGVIALAPPLPGQAGAVKTQLMINRIAQRLALKEETVWALLDELRRQAPRRGGSTVGAKGPVRRPGPDNENGAREGDQPDSERRQAPAAQEERELLEVLLADPALVPHALAEVHPDEVAHPGLRRLYEGLARLHQAGKPATLDLLRADLDHVRLFERALQMQEVGRANPNRTIWLRQILDQFRLRRERTLKQELHNQLQAASDPAVALEILRRLQNRSIEQAPDTTSPDGWGDSASPAVAPDSGVRS